MILPPAACQAFLRVPAVCVQNTTFEHVSLGDLTSRPCFSTIIYGFFNLGSAESICFPGVVIGKVDTFAQIFFPVPYSGVPVLVTEVIQTHHSPFSFV